jgi:hypothetical protein
VRPSGHIEAWLDSPNEEPRQLYPTRHHPAGAPHRFDEPVVRELVLKWQSERKPEVLDEILSAAEPVLKGTLLSRNGYSEDFDEVLNALRIRLGVNYLPLIRTEAAFSLPQSDRQSGHHRNPDEAESSGATVSGGQYRSPRLPAVFPFERQRRYFSCRSSRRHRLANFSDTDHLHGSARVAGSTLAGEGYA